MVRRSTGQRFQQQHRGAAVKQAEGLHGTMVYRHATGDEVLTHIDNLDPQQSPLGIEVQDDIGPLVAFDTGRHLDASCDRPRSALPSREAQVCDVWPASFQSKTVIPFHEAPAGAHL